MEPTKTEQPKSAQHRQIALGILGALVTVFCLANLGKVKVNWIIASWRTPLIVVIVVSALIGAGADRLVQRRSRPGRKGDVSDGRR